MKKSKLLSIVFFLLAFLLIGGCSKDDEGTDSGTTNQTQGQLLFKCKIDGVAFTAKSVITHGTSGIIIAKGLVASNGATPMDGTIRLTLTLGTNPQGELGLGDHQVVARLETANSPNNKNKATFESAVINGNQAYVKAGGTVNVEKYYQTTYWQGTKGTFSSITFDTFTPAPEYKQGTVTLTDGEFDVKYVIPGL